ncbi:MAG: thiamine pyrophosphate-binding protein [Hyphomicrobiales bacterium]|nr:thiamine pyrophosphate-binding protein [Hyphomicrobiales bacterium]
MISVGHQGDSEKKNTLSGAEAMVRMLQAHDVTYIFGLCGDTTLPFYDAMHRLDHPITHILTRDERHAGYMADGYARVTGKVGICEGPSGGGATYILPGIVEANESSVPVLAITSDVATTSRGRFPLTELDQKALFKPLTKHNDMLDDATRLPAQLRETFRTMTSATPGAAHLGFPFDTQNTGLVPDEVHGEKANGHFPSTRSLADPEAISEALNLLAEAKNAIIICGGGIVLSGAENELEQLAGSMNIPVATTVSGQGTIAETHPLALGVVGSNGGVPQTQAVVDQADLVFYIGCRAGSVTTERWHSPKPGTPIIHLDSDPKVIGVNYQTAAALVGDAKLTLARFNNALSKHNKTFDHDGKNRVLNAVTSKFQSFHRLAQKDESPVLPERVIADLQSVLDDEAIICADPGTPCPYFSAFYRWPKSGRHFISNRAHGALGYALAAAMGAQFGQPEAQVVAALGDGSFAFCCGEMETITRYNLPITIIVFSNSVFGWIKAGQKSGFGKRFHNVDFNRTDHAAVAEAYGIKSWSVEDPANLKQVLEEATSLNQPTLVDIISQPLQDANAPVSEWVA